jgi:BA14K-like protein
MNRFVKFAVLGTAAMATVLVPLAEANAQHRHRRHNNDAIAAGIVGLAAGAIIAGALSDQRPVYRERRVYQEVPVYDDEDVYIDEYPDAPPPPRRVVKRVIRYSHDLEPWSREWFRYCSNRYNSFNAETGTYRGYDGRNHFCTAG